MVRDGKNKMYLNQELKMQVKIQNFVTNITCLLLFGYI